MRTRLILGWLLLLSLVAAIGYAQTPAQTPVQAAPQAPARSLSLAEALDIARRNNPTFLMTRNDRSPASRNVLSATTSLFTPDVSIGGNYYWVDAGRQFLQGVSFDGPSRSQTSTSLNLGYRLSGATIANRGLAGAELRATDADIAGATTILETGIRTQYLLLAEAQAQASNSRRSLERVNEQLNLAQARYSVGQGTLIDVRRAEVDKATAEVNVLTTANATENQVLVLFMQMGVPAPEVPAIALTDSFPVIAPAWQLTELLTVAQEQNPSLRSLRARESSARWNTRAARSEYLPSLSFNAGTGRTTSNTSAFSVPDSAGNPIPVPAETERSKNPWQFSIGVSLPIFDGFGRYVRTAQARARQEDANLLVRARELQVRSDVVAAFNGLRVAYQSVNLQVTSRRAGAEALDLATQRYRVGSGSYLELLDARLAADRADTDYITAVYGYHRAIATLENAVGRPLR